MEAKNARLQGFSQLSPLDRLNVIKSFAELSDEEIHALQGGEGALSLESADKMIENVIGTFNLPLGIADNFQINGRDILIPMVVEEPSIVAATSYGAKLVRKGGGFQASHTDPLMIGQVQLVEIPDPDKAQEDILLYKEEIIALANQSSSTLITLGGGARDLEMAFFPSSPMGPMLIVHLLVDCRDAMGANAVNGMAERVAPLLQQISKGRAYLRIISNLSDRRLARARAVVPLTALARGSFSGEEVAKGIMWAYAFAAVDPYRATTHNKGILNAIDPLLVATGNDWRAVEAGAHAYASRKGHYGPLSTWEYDSEGLVGTIEIPLAVGIVGGATKVHPGVQAALKLLGVKSASELADICACVGLASNLAALRALATEGVQRGHMYLHARQIALSAGASGKLVDEIVRLMIEENNIKLTRAQELLSKLQN